MEYAGETTGECNPDILYVRIYRPIPARKGDL